MNRVPYYYAARIRVCPSAKATPERKAMVWDLLVYTNVNALEVVSDEARLPHLPVIRGVRRRYLERQVLHS